MQPRKPLHGPLPKPKVEKTINTIAIKISTKNIAMKSIRAGRLPETMWITEVV